MNTLELLREGVFRFSSGPSSVPRSDAHLVCDLLLCHVLQCSRESLILRHRDPVSESLVQQFFSLIEKISHGFPVAYILQRKEFFGLDFYVDERVLIPRPETELLVEEVLKICRSEECFRNRPQNCPLSIADIGTGSGCIAVSLAHSFPDACFIATDISSDALEVARKNIDHHGLSDRIILVQSDLLRTILNERINLIVANLPYIGEKENRYISPDVEQSEPHIALFGGSDGLRLYERLFEQISSLKYSPRFILGEFGFGQANLLRKLLHGFFGNNFRIVLDPAGIERIFIVSLS